MRKCDGVDPVKNASRSTGQVRTKKTAFQAVQCLARREDVHGLVSRSDSVVELVTQSGRFKLSTV